MAHVIKTQTSGYGFDPAKSISWDDKKRNAVERVLLRLWAAGFKIEDKSISRKHATISVSAVKPGSGSSLPTRSKITLEDEKTKFGTEIDGQRVTSGTCTVLQNDEHQFRLGKTTHIFRIKWHPVVLSVSSSSKETKAGKDPLAAVRNRLEDTDIKVVNNYIIGQTTHVVQGKRNTAKGLQALINAKYIVTDSFIDALIYATTPGDLDQDESLSPLEEDFDRHWPDAMQHVPPRGNEPRERPVEKFAPDPERANVFEGYTVVFCDKAQFESLQAPITNGGGKALYFQLKSGQTTTDELVGFIKNVAGEKGLGELEDGSEGKGVVVVKFRGGRDDFDWAAQLGKEASLALDLRFIEQNEFMDAILMNDASVLRRPLEVAENNDDPQNTNRETNQSVVNAPISQESQPEPSQPPPPPRRQRGLIKSRFKGFSDDEDDDKPSLSSIPHENESQTSQLNTQPAPPSEAPPQSTVTRKRPAPIDNDDDFVDQLLPAATAMKRRRLEAQEEARRRGDNEPPSQSQNNDTNIPSPTTTATTTKRKEQQPPLDIKASLRERRAAADQARALDEESLHRDLADEDIAALRDLAVVEEFDLAPPSHPSRTNGNGNSANGSNERWNPAWNGRKNFKKFRPQGSATAGAAGNGGNANARRGGQGVIVPLEEVKKRDFGIGEEYWLESGGKKDSSSLKRKRKERASRSQSQSRMVGEEENEEGEEEIEESAAGANGRARAKGKKKNVSRELVVEYDEAMPDVIDVEAPRRTRGMETQTQTQWSSAGKVASVGKGGRKQQSLFAVNEDESESEDELKFRFGKRRRMQQ